MAIATQNTSATARLKNRPGFFVVYLVMLFSFFTETTAQEQINFRNLNIRDGLSQSSVNVIFQDAKGFMWFGTQDGLNRYDGYSFKIFRNNPADTTTLADNFVFSIYEDKGGQLFIETLSGILHKFNAADESFQRLAKENVNLTGAKFSSVGALFEDPDGVRWTGGLGQPIGLTRLDTKTGRTTVYKNDPKIPGSLSDNKVYSIHRDKSGRLWVATLNGLDLLDEKAGKFTHFRNNPADPQSLPDNWIWPVREDSRGNLWIGTVKKGLCKFIPETGKFINYSNSPTDPGSISDNWIFSIYEDRSGVIWVGTNTGGVNYFHPGLQAFEHYIYNPGQNSLSDNDVISMLTDKNGNYWLGTRNGGVDRFDYKTKTFKNYPFNSVQVMLEDRNGILWFGTFSGGLMAFDPRTEKIRSYTNNPSDTASLSDNRVYALYEDSEGYLWVGTYGGGLNKFDRATGKFTRFLHDEMDKSSISINNVWSIAEDRSGNLWIGTYGGGVNIFDRTKNAFIAYRNDPANLSSLADDNVIRIFSDSKGNIWIGTMHGFSKYLKNGTFKNFHTENGLSNETVLAILEDSKGFLWLSTNNGLSRFDPFYGRFKNYYEQDGLQGNEFNQTAFAKDHITGRLLFGGPNGFNIFDPENIKENKFVPPVVLTGYLRYNTDYEEGKPIIEKGISHRDSIVLTYKDNIITIHFAALNFYNNYENEYRYKLEGFNDTWIQLGNNHNVTFTNLSPGGYILRVIGSNNDGVWNETGAVLNIKVLPPWWRTIYAYTAYAIMFVGMLYGLRRFELNQREQKAHLRETELRMKATEAEKRAIEAENERKTKELEEARQMQLSMLPKELPKLPHLELAAFMRTATEVGGDYYDFITQKNGILNIAFGDATGHGLQAGTMVTLMKGFFTSDAAKLELQDFMNHCSNMIKEIKLGRILMSFSFMRINENRLSVTSAGMPPVYYFNRETSQTEEILIQGMPLGAMRRFNYKCVERELKSGDTILLLTDGLPEQMNSRGEMYDYARVKERFNELANMRPDDIITELIKSGDDWMQDTVQADDISMVVIKVK